MAAASRSSSSRDSASGGATSSRSGSPARGVDVEALKARLRQKDDFQKYRWRCITNPVSALSTLTPTSKLEIDVVGARGLRERDTWVSSPLTDPFVRVFLDDQQLKGPNMQTKVAHGTLSPVWRDKLQVDILAPTSMVRLHVFDKKGGKDIGMGFVEFCVGDIPYFKEISGWLELRLQENMKATAHQRYLSHCAIREDYVAQCDSLEKVATADRRKRAAQKSQVANKVPLLEDLKARKKVVERVMQARAAAAIGCCSKPSNGPLPEHDVAANAGELYVTLRLTRVVRCLDAALALTLEPPRPQFFGMIERDKVEAAKKEAPKGELDLQKCMDSFVDVKLRLFEDFICCIAYFVRYVGTWRSVWISLPLFVAYVACAACSYLYWVVVPGTLAFILLINTSDALRWRMTRGGYNAMMSEHGFRCVAGWKNTSDMERYLKRLVENELNGTVTDHAKLRALASSCFRDGIPTTTLDEIKDLLRRPNDIVHIDSSVHSSLAVGDRVMVDERDRAHVASFNSDGLVNIHYDVDEDADGGKKLAPSSPLGKAGDAGKQSEPTTSGSKRLVAMDASRLQWRPKAEFRHTWLVPRRLRNLIMETMRYIDKLENTAVYPAARVITEIFTWKRKCVAASIFIGCTLFICACVRVWYIYEHPPENGGNLLDKADHLFIEMCRKVDNVVAAVVIFALFVSQARWLASGKALVKVAVRFPRDRARSAPASWAFFRGGEGFKEPSAIPSSSLSPSAKPSSGGSDGGESARGLSRVSPDSA